MSQQWWDLDDGTTGGSRRRRAAQAAKRRNQEKESRRKQLKSCSSSATEDGKKSSDLDSERPSRHRHTGHERGTRQRAAGHVIQRPVIQRPEHHSGACQADPDDSSISVECSQRSKSTLRRTRFRFDASESSNDETDEPLTREKRREIDLRLARHKKAKRAGLIDDSKPIRIRSNQDDLDSDSDDSTPTGETWRTKYWKKKRTEPINDAPTKEDTQDTTPKMRNAPTQNIGTESIVATRSFLDDELYRASASTYATAKGNPGEADSSGQADTRLTVAATAKVDEDPSETLTTQLARRRGRRAAINDCVDSRRVIMDEETERVEEAVHAEASVGGDDDDNKSPLTKSDDEDDESKASQAEAKEKEKPCATVVSKLPSEVDVTSDATPITHPDPENPRFKISDSDRGCWRTQRGCLLVRTVDDEPARTKVAAFDLDNTLVSWRTSHPSSLKQYELWNSCVVKRLRGLHDDGYKLVIITNQGGIRKSLYGATATKVENIIEWISRLVDRPVFAVASTDKEQFHKPKKDMWGIMENYTNSYKKVDKAQSFYVGDSDGASGGSYQMKGVDLNFAINAGVGKFYSPTDYFGHSNMVLRRLQTAEVPPPPLPNDAIRARKALLGGYREGPLLLLTVGVQGAGKTSFCEYITRDDSWCHFSQDTISGGKQKGSREAVERAVEAALRDNQSVVVDRMHLNSEQRRYFVVIGRRCNVPVHAIVFLASAEEVRQRVLDRTNHPGGVEGERLCHLGANNLINGNLLHPSYDEGFELISYSHEKEGRLWDAYCSQKNNTKRKSFQLFNRQGIPSLSLGTLRMNSAAQVVAESIELGIQSIDTAPTYNNEADVGRSIMSHDHVKLTVKVPKREKSPEGAREAVMKSLSKLGKPKAHLILIHWPCDLIECGTLDGVWRELEQMKKEGLCDAIGVSNFNVLSLKHLLSICRLKPSVNQVERHPLLPQYDLLDFCAANGILVQAHTPLGGSKEKRRWRLFEHDVVKRISNESGLSRAQVLLSWNLQQGVPVVAKWSSKAHCQEALDLLNERCTQLTGPQMRALDDMSQDSQYRIVAPDFMLAPFAMYSWSRNEEE